MTQDQPENSQKRGKQRPNRSASRIAAVQALYQMDVAHTDVNAVVEEFVSHHFSIQNADNPLRDADTTFFAEVLRGVIRRQTEIDQDVDAQLAKGWRLVRVDSILRAILRAGVFELLERPDVPARVVINEYIDVAHKFFSDDEPKVVNGVLDRIAKRVREKEFSTDRPASAPSGAANG